MAEYDRCHRAVYPKAGNGRRPYPLETMLRIPLHAALVQPERWCHGRCPVRNRLHAPVCPIILDSALPDRTTIMNFRHLLEQHQLARQLFTPSIAGWPKQAS